MIVLDTHAWVWWESDPDRLSTAARRALESSAAHGIPAITLLEVARLVERGRVRLDRPALAWLRTALDRPRVDLLPLTPEITVRSVTLPEEIGDPADRLIAATALEHACPLITKDGRLASAPGLRVVW